MDGEQHRKVRALLQPAFMPETVNKWRGQIDAVIRDDMLLPMVSLKRADLMEFGLSFPIREMSALMGFPTADTGACRQYAAWTLAMLGGNQVGPAKAPEARRQALTMFPQRWLEDDTAGWSSVAGESGHSWRITASGERFRWREESFFDVAGPLIGNGMQWYLQGRDWGTFYVSQLYDVAGACAGRPVKGIVALDQAWMAGGGAIHFKKELVVIHGLHVIWWSFATIYTDGSWDAGSFMVGHGKLGYAIFQDHLDHTWTSTDIERYVEHKPGSYFVAHAQITVDGADTWEFIPDPRGEMVDFVGGFPITAQQEGRWRRVGDTRIPDRSLGWGESDRRNGSARNVFGADLGWQEARA